MRGSCQRLTIIKSVSARKLGNDIARRAYDAVGNVDRKDIVAYASRADCLTAETTALIVGREETVPVHYELA